MSAVALPLLFIGIAALAIGLILVFRRYDKRNDLTHAEPPDFIVLSPKQAAEPWRTTMFDPDAELGAEGHVRPFPRPYEPPPPPIFDLSSCEFEEPPAYVPPPPPVPPEGSIAIDDPAVLSGAAIGCQTESGSFYRLTLVDLAEKHFMLTRRWMEEGKRKSATWKVLFCGCADGNKYYEGHVVVGGKMRLYEVLPDGAKDTDPSEKLFTSRIARCFLDVPDAAETRSA